MFLAAGVVLILLPNETVMYKMLIANYVTPDNIGTVQNNVVDFVGNIAEQRNNGRYSRTNRNQGIQYQDSGMYGH